MERNNVLKNTVMLTASGIIAKTVDFIFRTYYSKQLGREGTGLLSLVFTAHSIMLTLAAAGISVAISKVIASCIARRDMSLAYRSMKAALSCTLFSSVLVIAAVFLLSGYISEDILKDSRTRISLLFLSPSILFMGLSYCYKGYFYSVRKILIPASSEFVEQLVKISVISTLLSLWLPKGAEYGCRAVFLGLSIGEASSFLYLSAFYFAEVKRYAQKRIIHKRDKTPVLVPLLKIALPALLSSLSGSYLHMKEELLIVSGLKKHGLSPSGALSAYGTVSGMILPLTMFPLSLISSFLTLLVPEISRAAARADKTRLLDLAGKVYKFAAVGAFLIMTVFFSAPSEIVEAAYSLEDAGGFVMIFATLLPVFLCDSVSHGILNGLGKQATLLVITLSECILRIFICFVFVPKLGVSAIILTVYAGNLFSVASKLLCVLVKTGLRFNVFEWVIFPFCLTLTTAFISGKIFICPAFINTALAVKILTAAGLYIILSFVFGFLKRDEICWIKSRLLSGK